VVFFLDKKLDKRGFLCYYLCTNTLFQGNFPMQKVTHTASSVMENEGQILTFEVKEPYSDNRLPLTEKDNIDEAVKSAFIRNLDRFLPVVLIREITLSQNLSRSCTLLIVKLTLEEDRDLSAWKLKSDILAALEY
jgi:hypothetical protein